MAKAFNDTILYSFFNRTNTQVHVKPKQRLNQSNIETRVLSMANATLGVVSSGSLAVHAIGQGLAHARGLITKHAIKQADRLLSNTGIDVWDYCAYWVPYLIGPRRKIRVALEIIYF